ncbi:hypothetical protein ACHAXR_004981 [Thalassiosira sp. AJA248-18]
MHGPNYLQYCFDKGWYYVERIDSWYGRECGNDDLDDKGRCPKCRSLYKNINRTKHPLLFQPAISSASIPAAASTLIPSVSEVQRTVAARIKLLDEDEVPQDKEMKEAAEVLKLNKCQQIEVGNSKMFIVCSNCTSPRICQKRSTNVNLCKDCQSSTTTNNWIQKRREGNKESRNSAYSTVPWASRTKEELKNVSKTLNQERKSLKACIKMLKKKIKDTTVEKECTDEVFDQFDRALEHAKRNTEKLRGDIKTTLTNMIKDETSRVGTDTNVTDLSEDDTERLADYLIETIQNYSLKKVGKKNRVRFSPYLMGISMAQFLQSGPSSYERHRGDSLVVLPSADRLSKIKQQQDVREGACPSLYEEQIITRGCRLEMGEIMCDEMKIKENILYTVSNKKVVGFTEDFVCKKKIMKNMLDDDEVDTFCHPATYVNQWRYRSVNGRSFNCEFWYNSGSLTGNALLEQFNRVVMSCEAVGSAVLGFVTDAGGNNARLMKLLRGNISYELDLQQFFCSEDFSLICYCDLPGRLGWNHGACVMMCMSLSEFFVGWLQHALKKVRRKKNPELFDIVPANCLTLSEQNNKVNSFLGWSIFSTLKRKAYDGKSEKESVGKKILLSMMMREHNIDEDYMSKYYDPNMAMLNHGGLTLCDPKNCFDKAENAIMKNQTIKLQFMELCRQHSGVVSAEEEMAKVYAVFVPKTIHARFGVDLRRWKENKVKKNGQVDFRTKLKATAGLSKSLPVAQPKEKRKASSKSKGTEIPTVSKDKAKLNLNRKKRRRIMSERQSGRQKGRRHDKAK